jgi:hypothetical protein
MRIATWCTFEAENISNRTPGQPATQPRSKSLEPLLHLDVLRNTASPRNAG